MQNVDWLDGYPLRGVNLKHARGISNCPTMSATADVAAAFNEISLLPEHVWIGGALDSKFRLISWNIVGTGIVPHIRPIDVFAGAVVNSVTRSFLVRNEPNTSLHTSAAFDLDLLSRLCATGALLGYSFLDYVVVGKDLCRSVLSEVRMSKQTHNAKSRRRALEQARESHESKKTYAVH